MKHYKDNIAVFLIFLGFVRTPIVMNSFRVDGKVLRLDDIATRKGMKVDDFACKMVHLEDQKNERFLFVEKRDWGYI